MGPVEWKYKPVRRFSSIKAARNVDIILGQLPRRERPAGTEDILYDSAFPAAESSVENSNLDDVAPASGDLTLESDVEDTTDPSTSGLFYRDGASDGNDSESDEDDSDSGSDAGSDFPTGGDDSLAAPVPDSDPLDHLAEAFEGADILGPTVSGDFEMEDSTTAYSGSPHGSTVSLDSTLVGSTEVLCSHTFGGEKMGGSDIEDAEAIIVDDNEDYMVISCSVDCNPDVDMADAPRRRKFKFTKALKRILNPTVTVPKAILTGLASKRVFTPYNPLRSRSRRTMARSSEPATSPYGC